MSAPTYGTRFLEGIPTGRELYAIVEFLSAHLMPAHRVAKEKENCAHTTRPE
jgi:hypothetical protein